MLCDVLRNGLLPLALLLTLSGCDVASRDTTNDGFSMSSLAGYNFSAEGIQEFYVDGAWGSGVSIGGGGGSVCCVKIPANWRADLRVTIEWRRSDCGGVDGNSHSRCAGMKGDWPMKTLKKTIPIEPYSEPGTTQVMFLPNDEIKIYVRDDAPWGPDHPSHLGGPRPLTADEAKSLLER